MNQRANEQGDLLALMAVVVSASVAGLSAPTGAKAGLLTGPSYCGAYLGVLAVALLVGKRWIALGMVAALLIGVPAFFGLAVLSSFPATP